MRSVLGESEGESDTFSVVDMSKSLDFIIVALYLVDLNTFDCHVLSACNLSQILTSSVSGDDGLSRRRFKSKREL